MFRICAALATAASLALPVTAAATPARPTTHPAAAALPAAATHPVAQTLPPTATHPKPVAPHVPGRYPLRFLHVEPPAGPGQLARIVDATGRQVLLRGVDVNGLEDYYSTRPPHTRVAYPIRAAAYRHHRCPARDHGVESMTVCWFDAAQWQRFGYDVIRLGLSWSLLEPRPGQISHAYLDRIAQVVRWAGQHDVYVVLDLHQDAWSKYLFTPPGAHCPPPTSSVGNGVELDGAPRWATDTSLPVCRLGQRELDPAVAENFQRLWSDLPGPDGIGLQEHLASVFVALARRFAHTPAVAGYELLNEPNPGFEPPPAMDETTLFPFYAKVIAAVRRAVPGFRQLFFIEPDITRDVTDVSAITVPWSAYSKYPNVVYAPHIYTRVFTADALLAAQLGTPKFLPMGEGYATAAMDARVLGLPLWVGEFGNFVAHDATVLAAHYANQDRLGIGSGLWVWKADGRHHGRNGFSVMHGPFGRQRRGVAFPSRVRFTRRGYPVYVAGRLETLRYQPAPRTPSLQIVAVDTRPGRVGSPGAATVLFLPKQLHGPVRVSNAAVAIRRVAGGNRLAWVWPLRPGRYRVSVAITRDSSTPIGGAPGITAPSDSSPATWGPRAA